MKRQRREEITYNEYRSSSYYNENHVGEEEFPRLSMLQERVIESFKSDLRGCI